MDTPADNFINILLAAFALIDPKSIKRLDCHFYKFGICTCKMLVKLALDLVFNISSKGEGKIGVQNDGIYSNSTSQEICGFAFCPDPNFPGSLLVTFPTSKEIIY